MGPCDARAVSRDPAGAPCWSFGFDGAGGDERMKVRAGDSHVFADLVEADPAFGDQPAHEAYWGAEFVGDVLDIEHALHEVLLDYGLHRGGEALHMRPRDGQEKLAAPTARQQRATSAPQRFHVSRRGLVGPPRASGVR